MQIHGKFDYSKPTLTAIDEVMNIYNHPTFPTSNAMKTLPHIRPEPENIEIPSIRRVRRIIKSPKVIKYI